MLLIVSRLIDTITFGAARRRRRMARLLAELDRMPIDALPTGHPAGSSYRPARRPGFSGLRAVATLTVWVLIIGGVVFLARLGSHKSADASTPASPAAPAFGQDAAQSHQSLKVGGGASPPAGTNELPNRVLPAPAIPPGAGGYTFLQMNGKTPVAYDSCRPIHYVIRDHETPTGGDQTIRQAVAAVSRATGLKFIDDGVSTEVPILKRPSYQPLRYGDEWAPVLIAWTDAKESPLVAGDVVGYGGSQSYSSLDQGHEGDRVYVSGTVGLDAPDMTEALTPPGGAGVNLAVVEHELGHLVGLDHVKDRRQIMYPAVTTVTSYAAGDLRGLALLGRGACHPEL
jgi:hypothetical protein